MKQIEVAVNKEIKDTCLIASNILKAEITQYVDMFQRFRGMCNIYDMSPPKTLMIKITLDKQVLKEFQTNIKRDERYKSETYFIEQVINDYDNYKLDLTPIKKKTFFKNPTSLEVEVDAKVCESFMHYTKDDKKCHSYNEVIVQSILAYNEQMKTYQPPVLFAQRLRIDENLLTKWEECLKQDSDYKYQPYDYSKKRLFIEQVMIKYKFQYDILAPYNNQLNKVDHSFELVAKYYPPLKQLSDEIPKVNLTTFKPEKKKNRKNSRLGRFPGLMVFADFETCFDKKQMEQIQSRSQKIIMKDYYDLRSRVYGAGWTWGNSLDECEKNLIIGNSVEDFIGWVSHYLHTPQYKKEYKSAYCYFHNLKYDFAFMKREMLQDLGDVFYEDVLGDDRKLYQLIITSKITGNTFNLVDNLHIQRMKLSQLPTLKFGKKSGILEQDMSIIRDIDHQLTKDEREYLIHDVLTLADSVLLYFRDKPHHLTTSGYAMKVWLEQMRKLGLNHFFQQDKGFLSLENRKRLNNYNHCSFVFNKQTDIDVLLDLEAHYKGGQTLVNWVFQERILSNVSVIDVNSLYPATYQKCKVPYFSNVHSNIKYKSAQINMQAKSIKLDNIQQLTKIISICEDISQSKLSSSHYLQYEIIMDIKLKDGITFSPMTPGMCLDVLEAREFINPKNRSLKDARVCFGGSEYDLLNWLNYYDISNIELINYFIFDILEGHALHDFRSIMANWCHHKEYYSQDKELYKYEIAYYKLLMNSLTGKFGEKMRFEKTIVQDGEFVEVNNEQVRSRLLPIILSLISHSRLFMGESMLKVKDQFVYSDTDSIAVVNMSDEQIKKVFEVDPSHVGLFDIEKHYLRAIYMKRKTYVGLLSQKDVFKKWKKANEKLYQFELDLNDMPHEYYLENRYQFVVAGCKVRPDLYADQSLNTFVKGKSIIGVKIMQILLNNGIHLREIPFVFKGDEGIANNLYLKALPIPFIKYIKDRELQVCATSRIQAQSIEDAMQSMYDNEDLSNSQPINLIDGISYSTIIERSDSNVNSISFNTDYTKYS